MIYLQNHCRLLIHRPMKLIAFNTKYRPSGYYSRHSVLWHSVLNRSVLNRLRVFNLKGYWQALELMAGLTLVISWEILTSGSSTNSNDLECQMRDKNANIVRLWDHSIFELNLIMNCFISACPFPMSNAPTLLTMCPAPWPPKPFQTACIYMD